MTSTQRPLSDSVPQRAEFAMAVAGVAWWEFDAETGALRFDAGMTALLGYPPVDVAQDADFAELVHPDDVGVAADAMREHLMGESPEYRVDYRIRTHDGEYRWFESVGRVRERGEDGEPLTVVGVFSDITERLRTAHTLRLTHGRLRHAEEVARFGHWELSLDDRVVYASDGALRIYGMDRASVPLVDAQACVLAEHRPTLDRALNDLISNAVPYDQVFRLRRVNDGVIVWVHSRAEYDPLTRRVFGVAHDISDRKCVEEEREALIVELQRALDQVKTLSGILPICSSCKMIRDDDGAWEAVDTYVLKHTDAQFSHGICPECLTRLYPDLA